MRRLRVWYGCVSVDGEQLVCVVAARTRKRVLEVLNQRVRVTAYEFRNYWTVTSNAYDTEVALSNPERIIINRWGHSPRPDYWIWVEPPRSML